MQVGDAQLVEVVEVVHDTRQRPREAIRVRHVADHRGSLEPVGLRLTFQVAEKQFVGAGRDMVRNPLAQHHVEFVRVVGIQPGEARGHRRPMATESCMQHLLPQRCRLVSPPIHRDERILALVQALMTVDEWGSGDAA